MRVPADSSVFGVTGHGQYLDDGTTVRLARAGQNGSDERHPLGGFPSSLPSTGHSLGAPVTLNLAGGAGVATCSPSAAPAPT